MRLRFSFERFIFPLFKSILERKTTRQKVMDNRLRLGQFVTQRQGAHFEEKWIEGYRFKELDS